MDAGKATKNDHVFISYSSKDVELANEICAGLERDGIQCWIAPRDVESGAYAASIIRGIRSARSLLFVASESSASGAAGRNLQSRKLISFDDKEQIDETLLWQRVSEDYFLIIPHDRVTDAVNRLRAAFGVFKTPVARVNVSKAAAVAPPAGMVQTIRAANALDDALYQRVVAEFDDKLERAVRIIASHCLQRADDDLA